VDPCAWSLYEYAYVPGLNEYTEVDSSLCHTGIPELRRLVDENGGSRPSLANVSFKQLDWRVSEHRHALFSGPT